MTGQKISFSEIYMAWLVKYSLENKSYAKNKVKVKFNSIKLNLKYCSQKDNNLKINDYLKNLDKAAKNVDIEKVM